MLFPVTGLWGCRWLTKGTFLRANSYKYLRFIKLVQWMVVLLLFGEIVEYFTVNWGGKNKKFGRREGGAKTWTCWIETQITLKNGNCLRAGNNFKASDTSQPFVDTTIAMFLSLLPAFYAGMLGSILGCLTSSIDNKRIEFFSLFPPKNFYTTFITLTGT